MNEDKKFAIDRLRERVAKLKDRGKDATDVVIHDRFDQANWDEIREFPAVAEFITEMREKHDYVEDFLADVYHLIAKGDPSLRFKTELKMSHRIHQPVMSTAKDNAATEELRTLTVADPYAAAMGLVSMQPELRDVLDMLQNARDRAKEAEEKEPPVPVFPGCFPGGGSGDGDGDGDGEPGNEPGEPGTATGVGVGSGVDESEPTDEELEAWTRKIEEAEAAAAEADEAQARADAAAEAAARQAREKLAEGARRAADDREEEDRMIRSYGLEEGPVKQMDFDERAELSQLLSKSRLKEFSKLIGQFASVQASMSRRRVNDVPDEITNVHLSDDLLRMTPGEMANFATPELEGDMWLRYTQRALLTYELTGTEKQGQGPIIVVCDESESMDHNRVMGGTAEAWSKALSLALLTQARQQGRDFIYIGFSGMAYDYGTGQRHPQIHTLRFPKGQGELTDVLQMTEHFFSGGTYYEAALREAMGIVQEYERERKPKPDIVFITDQAYGHLQPDFVHEFNEVKTKTSMRCFGIAVCALVNGVLEAVCDNTRSITELAGSPEEVSDIFRMI